MRAAQRRRVLARPPGPRLTCVEDLRAAPDAIAVRLYRPLAGPRPLVVFLHGGMWALGDLDSHDRACRLLAASTGAAVLAVDFRRAPEHPWPAAVDDAVQVARWAAGNMAALAATALAIAGDSSGGNLAALTCLRLRDEGGPVLAAQVLITPNTDLTFSQRSVREKASGWGLDAEDIRWAAGLWVPDPALRADPRVSPLHAADLSGLPSAVIVTAEHDPLRGEGDAYACRLAAAGVPVRHRVEPGMIHGFLTLDTVSAAAAADRLFADIAWQLAAVTGALSTGRHNTHTPTPPGNAPPG
jgi:acetyl esterase